MSGYLVDTSIFIAAEQRRPLSDPPGGEARISVATLTELILGVRRAAEGGDRGLRQATLDRARTFVALPYDELVAERVADLAAAALGQSRHARVMESIIAATALVHGLAVWTQDDGFDVLNELEPALRIHKG